ncbi:MAG: hypothetical protein IKE55_01530, partial [Kiritimatiellae bacterium]|nr:hypothetical protein [Kiritimatiellia bacterium]
MNDMKKIAIGMLVAAAALVAAADTYTVDTGDTLTLTSITNTSRFTKDGGGTLILTGTNSLATLTSSAGTLNFHGGETTISGSGSSGAYESAAFANYGNELVVDGGATVIIAGGAYGHTDNGVLRVEDGTLDATGLGNDFMNGFHGSYSSSRLIINDGGVVKAGTLRVVGGSAGSESKKENFSIDLNAGGSLYVNTFWEDNGSRYGRINFNGGVLYPTREGSNDTSTHLFFQGDSNITWTQSMVTPTVLAGGCYIQLSRNNFVYPAFKSGVAEGEMDGGLHVRGGAVLYWRAKGSTYNGGTWLEGNGNFALNGGIGGDSSLGAVPATPATNIWIMSNHILFSESGTMNIHSNRMIFVKNGATFSVGTQGRLVIGGEIKTEPSPGLDYTTNNLFWARGEWAGTVIIGPGEGITNNLGRLRVGAGLEVTNGVFSLTGGQKMGEHDISEFLYVQGNGSSFSNTKGHLKLTAGEIYSTQSNYAEVSKYGHVEVVGGKVNTPNGHWLIGLTGAA